MPGKFLGMKNAKAAWTTHRDDRDLNDWSHRQMVKRIVAVALLATSVFAVQVTTVLAADHEDTAQALELLNHYAPTQTSTTEWVELARRLAIKAQTASPNLPIRPVEVEELRSIFGQSETAPAATRAISPVLGFRADVASTYVRLVVTAVEGATDGLRADGNIADSPTTRPSNTPVTPATAIPEQKSTAAVGCQMSMKISTAPTSPLKVVTSLVVASPIPSKANNLFEKV